MGVGAAQALDFLVVVAQEECILLLLALWLVLRIALLLVLAELAELLVLKAPMEVIPFLQVLLLLAAAAVRGAVLLQVKTVGLAEAGQKAEVALTLEAPQHKAYRGTELRAERLLQALEGAAAVAEVQVAQEVTRLVAGLEKAALECLAQLQERKLTIRAAVAAERKQEPQEPAVRVVGAMAVDIMIQQVPLNLDRTGRQTRVAVAAVLREEQEVPAAQAAPA